MCSATRKWRADVFPASAEFYLRDENRLLTKEHIYYAVEQHEYVYFFLAEHLDLATLQKQIGLSRQAGLARVRPHKEHMCSYVTLVILADTIDPDAAVLLRKTRLRKKLSVYAVRLDGIPHCGYGMFHGTVPFQPCRKGGTQNSGE